MKLSTKAITKTLQKAGAKLSEHSPAILVGVTVVGVVTTVAMTAKATIKAKEIVAEADIDRMDEYVTSTEESPKYQALTKEDIVRLTWKCYIPVVAVAGLTIASAIGSYKIQNHRSAALAALYSTSIKALEEYQAKTEDVVGSKKAEDIRAKLAEDKMAQHPVDKSNIIITGDGDTLCFDVLSGRYFKSDIQIVQQARNDMNHRLLSENCLSLNEWYGLLNLDSIGLGDDFGWNVDRMMELNFTSRLASDGTPCLVIDYITMPKYEYRWG